MRATALVVLALAAVTALTPQPAQTPAMAIQQQTPQERAAYYLSLSPEQRKALYPPQPNPPAPLPVTNHIFLTVLLPSHDSYRSWGLQESHDLLTWQTIGIGIYPYRCGVINDTFDWVTNNSVPYGRFFVSFDRTNNVNFYRVWSGYMTPEEALTALTNPVQNSSSSK